MPLTPSEILSYLSPQERDAALTKLLEVHLTPRDGMTREDWDCLRFAHFEEHADELVADVEARAIEEAVSVAEAQLRRAMRPNHLAFNGTGVAA